MRLEHNGVTLESDSELTKDDIVQAMRSGYRQKGLALSRVYVVVDGAFLNVWSYSQEDAKHFDRIRRITGYLSGTLDRFNDAKKAEVADRKKHRIGR